MPNKGASIFRHAYTTETLNKDLWVHNVNFQAISLPISRQEQRSPPLTDSPLIQCTHHSFPLENRVAPLEASLCLLVTALRSFGSDVPPKNFISAKMVEASLVNWRSSSLQWDLELAGQKYGSNICKWTCIVRRSLRHLPLILLHCKRLGTKELTSSFWSHHSLHLYCWGIRVVPTCTNPAVICLWSNFSGQMSMPPEKIKTKWSSGFPWEFAAHKFPVL